MALGLYGNLQTTYGWSKTSSRIRHELYGRYHKYSARSSGLLYSRFTRLVSPTFNSLGQPCQMQYIENCYPSRPCQRLMCFGTLPALPCTFFMAPRRIQKDMMHSIVIHECGWYSKTHLGVRNVSKFNFNWAHFLTTFKGSSSIISQSSSQLASSSQSTVTSTIQSANRGKTYRPEHSQTSARGAPCTFYFFILVRYIFSYIVF
jgi:hypothetical protein